MSMRHLLCSFAFCLFSLLVHVAHSADAATGRIESVIRKNMEQEDKRCARLVDELYKNSREFIGYIAQYRFCYPYREGFSPFPDELVDEMTEMAFLADTSKDPAEAQRNLVDYGNFVKLHLGNLDVLKMAYTLSKQNARYGNPAFFKKVMDAMKESIYPTNSPDALSPENAYIITNYAEENYILSRIGGKIKRSEVYEVGSKFYNVHDIEDPETGTIRQFYFDISIPVSMMRQKEENRKLEEGADVLKL